MLPVPGFLSIEVEAAICFSVSCINEIETRTHLLPTLALPFRYRNKMLLKEPLHKSKPSLRAQRSNLFFLANQALMDRRVAALLAITDLCRPSFTRKNLNAKNLIFRILLKKQLYGIEIMPASPLKHIEKESNLLTQYRRQRQPILLFL